jgi:RimJ/RimL family protein N-acetyltransferase
MKKQKVLKHLSKKSPPAKIKTKRLILKKLDLKMAKAIFNEVDLNRKHLGRFLPWVGFINNESDESKWIELQRQKWFEKSQFVYAIFLAQDEIYLGNIDAHAIDWKNHKAEIKYPFIVNYGAPRRFGVIRLTRGSVSFTRFFAQRP